jgi:hypothetical protein
LAGKVQAMTGCSARILQREGAWLIKGTLPLRSRVSLSAQRVCLELRSEIPQGQSFSVLRMPKLLNGATFFLPQQERRCEFLCCCRPLSADLIITKLAAGTFCRNLQRAAPTPCSNSKDDLVWTKVTPTPALLASQAYNKSRCLACPFQLIATPRELGSE